MTADPTDLTKGKRGAAVEGMSSTADLAAILCDLSGTEGLLEISGSEHRDFLQNQLSTDVRKLTRNTGQFCACSNAKGRVVATLRVFERAGVALLALPQDLVPELAAYLQRYVLRSLVTITDVSERSTRLGLAGDAARALLEACGCEVPVAANGLGGREGILLMRLPGATPRFAIYGEPATVAPLRTELEQRGAMNVEDLDWTRLRILAGEPALHPSTSGRFLPQSLGLEELDAVHLNKGCYLGQEVIARAHYRGTVKRHLRHARCESAQAIVPGSTIHAATREAPVAEVVEAAPSRDGTGQLLIVMQDEFITAPLFFRGAAVELVA